MEEIKAMKKLSIINAPDLFYVKSNVVVHFCTPGNVYSGANPVYLDQLIEKLGVEQLECVVKFRGMVAGTVNFLDVPETEDFKRLAFCVLPPSFDGDGLFDLYLCYRNALDKAAESDHKTVTFMHPSMYQAIDEAAVARTAICTTGVWLIESPYREKIHNVTIACSSPDAHDLHKRILGKMLKRTRPIDSHPMLRALLGGAQQKELASPTYRIHYLETMLQEEIRRYAANVVLNAMLDRVITEESVKECRRLLADPNGVRANENQLYTQLFFHNGMAMPQLSRQLNYTVLLVEADDGRVHSFIRNSAMSHGNFLVFFCAKCDAASKRTRAPQRAKAIVEDGVMRIEVDDHHIECHPESKCSVIIAQLRRRLLLHWKASDVPAEAFDEQDSATILDGEGEGEGEGSDGDVETVLPQLNHEDDEILILED